MKQLRIGSVNYDTVGEASVTQTLTSGTEIATVTIDGTSTKLYAPSGGGGSTVTVTPILASGTQTATINVDGTSTTLYAPTPPTVPSASSAAPSMDGTAAVGTATTYARADHVHPTDTTLVPKSATSNGQTTQINNDGSSVQLVSAKDSNYADAQIGRNGNASVSLYAETTGSHTEIIVAPTGVSIDKLVTPTTSTMPTTKQYVDDGLAAKQATLVSGTNIKTINSQSILGSGDLTIQEGTEMVVLKYGISTWADFEAVYPNAVVYCRASSNANPASGSQTRMAFMAYVNNENSPTEVEFQYYRSVSTKSAAQQGDQVFVYKLNKTNGWSVTTREASTKIVAGTNMTQSYASGTLTLAANSQLPSVSASDNDKVLMVVNGAWAAASLPIYDGTVE